MIPDAECVRIVCEILMALKLKNFVVKVCSHTKVWKCMRSIYMYMYIEARENFSFDRSTTENCLMEFLLLVVCQWRSSALYAQLLTN